MKNKSTIDIVYNVGIRKVNRKTGEVQEIYGSNRVCRNLINGIVKFIKGDFNSYDSGAVQYIPNSLGVGSGVEPVTVGDINLDVPIQVYVPLAFQPDDWETHYTDYYTYDAINDIYISCTDDTFISNHIFKAVDYRTYLQRDQNLNADMVLTGDTASINLSFYISDNELEGETITELGLFTDSNNLSARYLLPSPIIKAAQEFMDITWQISVRSYHEDEEE